MSKSDKMPKVTVVTATYNLIKEGREQFFRQCVESVHNQTYKNIEHLIIDGASNDGSIDLIKEYADKGWIKYVSEPDKGMCDAMNKGIKMAKGEYIAILNSDDFYSENAVEKSIKALLESKADYSYADTNMLDRKSLKLLKIWYAPEFSFAHFYYIMPFNHEAMFCKKSIYEKIGYYDWQKYDTIADYDFVMKLILSDYKRVYVNSPILQFRMDGTTNITNGRKSNSYSKHISNLYKLYFDLWSKILPQETIEKLKHFIDTKDYMNSQTLAYLQQDCILYYYIKFLAEKKLKNFPWEYLFSAHMYNKNNVNQYDVKYIKLFNVLPILKMLNKNGKIYCSLFNLLPLMKTSYKGQTIRYKLFNFLPFLKITTENRTKRCKLFGFIPLLKIKEK